MWEQGTCDFLKVESVIKDITSWVGFCLRKNHLGWDLKGWKSITGDKDSGSTSSSSKSEDYVSLGTADTFREQKEGKYSQSWLVVGRDRLGTDHTGLAGYCGSGCHLGT